MSGIETIVEYGCLSDEQRWHAKRYDWQWLTELDENDRWLVGLLDCLADGEFSGQASAPQFHYLLLEELANGFPKELACDWGEVLAYGHIISYEEMRHGLSLATANHYVKTGELDFISKVSVREFGKRYVWCYQERKYWDLYAFLLAHLFGEVVNTELYRDMRIRIHHPELKQIVTNIMTDEARHTRAWAALIKNLVQSDPRHEERALRSLDRGLTYHNAMVHETFFEGQNKMMQLFLPARAGKKGALDRIIEKKHGLLVEIFGDRNPLSEEDVKAIHLRFLTEAQGATRAVYSPDAAGNIQFIREA